MSSRSERRDSGQSGGCQPISGDKMAIDFIAPQHKTSSEQFPPQPTTTVATPRPQPQARAYTDQPIGDLQQHSSSSSSVAVLHNPETMEESNATGYYQPRSSRNTRFSKEMESFVMHCRIVKRKKWQTITRKFNRRFDQQCSIAYLHAMYTRIRRQRGRNQAETGKARDGFTESINMEQAWTPEPEQYRYTEEMRYFVMHGRIVKYKDWPTITWEFNRLFNQQRSVEALAALGNRTRLRWGMDRPGFANNHGRSKESIDILQAHACEVSSRFLELVRSEGLI